MTMPYGFSFPIATLCPYLLALGIIYPLLPFQALQLGASEQIVVLVIATYTVAAFAMAPVWGALSDRVGRKSVILAGLVGSAVAYVLLSQAQTVQDMFVARALAGASAGVVATTQALIADRTGPDDRAAAMGQVNRLYGLAFIIGPVIGGLAIDAGYTDFQTPALIAAGLSIGAFLIGAVSLHDKAIRTRPESDSQSLITQSERGANTTDRWRHMPALAIFLIFGFGFTYAAMDSTLAFWASGEMGWGPREVGYLFAAAGGGAVLSQGATLRAIIARCGECHAITIAAVTLAGGLALIPLADNALTITVAMVLAGAGLATGLSCLQSLVSKTVILARRGCALGTAQSATSLSRILGAVYGGFCFAQLGPMWPYLSGAIALSVIAAALTQLSPKLGRSVTSAGTLE